MYKESYSSALLDKAVDQLASLPGIGRKNALRLALHLLNQPAENVHSLGHSLIDLREGVRYCSECNMITDNTLCDVCANPKRDHSTLCLVESVRDVLSIESTGEYRGIYFVLGGLISPMDGIGPDDLSIDKMIKLVARKDFKEIILALSTSMEGETTSFYICKLLNNNKIKISTIARGVGFGDELEYTDRLTLGKAISARVLIKNE